MRSTLAKTPEFQKIKDTKQQVRIPIIDEVSALPPHTSLFPQH
jgi:hypothetical protein